MTAWLDEFRIVKGTAAWTSGFTPPATAYTTGDVAAFTGTVGAAGVTGTLATTEAADTAAFTGTVAWNAVLAATEAADVAAFTGTARWNATLAATEAADTAAFTGTVATPGTTTGSLNTTEAADTPAFTGTVTGVAGTLAATEAADVAAFTGNIVALAATGTLAATESADVAAFVGSLSATITAKLVTSYAPGLNRNDLTILVGMEFRLTVDTPFNGIGLRRGLNNTGLHTVSLYNRATNTLLRSANVDLTGKTEGTFYYADIAPITLVTGTTYALVTLVTASDGQQWADAGSTTLKDAQPGSVFAAYSLPPGAAFTTTSFADTQYVGVDLSYAVTVPDVTRPRGAGFVDVGREKRRNPRGLRQAQKFFKEQQEARDAEKRRLEQVAQRAREKAEQEAARALEAGEFARAQAILAAAVDQQQRQTHLDNMMMALANARVDEARQRLMQVQHAQAMQRDEEDAISVLLLH